MFEKYRVLEPDELNNYGFSIQINYKKEPDIIIYTHELEINNRAGILRMVCKYNKGDDKILEVMHYEREEEPKDWSIYRPVKDVYENLIKELLENNIIEAIN